VDRRAFITTIGLTVLAKPIAARAQQPTKIPRIGFLATGSIGSPEFRGVVDPFWRGLRDLGYVERRNLIIEYRSADVDPVSLGVGGDDHGVRPGQSGRGGQGVWIA
jgi:hypothetical protein